MLNECHIIGHLAKDPVLRYTPKQTPVCNFSVGTDSGEKDQNGKEITQWFNVVAWEKQAELCSAYLKKGKLVYVRGRIRTSPWESKDGKKGVNVELVASRVQFLSKKEDGAPDQARSSEPGPDNFGEPPPPSANQLGDFGDGIPF